MSRVECDVHVWLVTSENLNPANPTIRVKCWLCSKRHRWPAALRRKTRGRWRDWEERTGLRRT